MMILFLIYLKTRWGGKTLQMHSTSTKRERVAITSFLFSLSVCKVLRSYTVKCMTPQLKINYKDRPKSESEITKQDYHENPFLLLKAQLECRTHLSLSLVSQDLVVVHWVRQYTPHWYLSLPDRLYPARVVEVSSSPQLEAETLVQTDRGEGKGVTN